MSDLRAVLDDIRKEHGRLTPRILVDVARDKQHPLHHHVYDRSPKDAAEAWYLNRAHELIQSIRVTYRSGEQVKTVRAFHAVRVEDEQNGGYVYEPLETVAEDPFLRQLVLRDMEREWRTLERRYRDFDEFWRLIQGSTEAATA